MNRFRLLLFTFFIFQLPVLSFSQSAAEMDAMLQADKVSAAEAAYFALGAADQLQGIGSVQSAYDSARSKGWVLAARDASLTAKDAAFLIMRAFGLKGGLMYSLLKNPRYAYREMVYKGLVSRMDQAERISGAMFLSILDRTLSSVEGNMP